MFEKLEELSKKFEEVILELLNPEIVKNFERFQKLSRERSELEPIIDTYNEYKKIIKVRNEARNILEKSNDIELKEIAQIELEESEEKLQHVEEILKSMK